MSDRDFSMTTRLIVRLSLIVLIVLLAVVLSFTGKQHQFLLDNNTKESNGSTYSSLSIVEVSIDDQEPLEIPRRTRLNSYATGQRHTLTVTYSENGNEVIKSAKFKVPVGEEMTLISIPAFVKGADESIWKEEFVSTQKAVEESDASIEDDMSMDIEF